MTPPFGPEQEIEVLITVKAYPRPSTKYGESVCLAGVRLDTPSPQWCRLYPVDFRGLPRDQRFHKYEILRCRARPPSNDSRPESLCPIEGTLERVGQVATWEERWEHLEPIAVGSMCELLELERAHGTSLGIFRPREIHDFRAKQVAPTWDEGKQAALNQQSLLKTPRARPLEKVPYEFRFVYRCEHPTCRGHKQQLIDWELAENYRKTQGEDEEERIAKVRDRWLNVVCGPHRDAHFFAGSLFLHQHSFVLLGVFWPRKASLAPQELALF